MRFKAKISWFHVFSITVYLCTGLSHHPRSEKSEMMFYPERIETYLEYTKSIREFLSQYDAEKQDDGMKFEECGGTKLNNFLMNVDVTTY